MAVVSESGLDWAGEFSSRSLERDFRASRRTADDAVTRAVLLAAVLGQLNYAHVDRTVLAGSSLLGVMYGARACLVTFGLVLAYLVPRLSIGRRDSAVGFLVFFALPIQALGTMARPPGLAGPLVSAVMAVFFLNIVLAIPARARALLAMGTCAAHLVGRAANPEPLVGLGTPPALVLGTAFLAAAVVGVTLQRSRRLEFLAHREQQDLRASLEQALAEIRTLRGIVPICSFCKSIRDEHGAWHRVEVYVRDRTHAEFSHGFCPTCAAEHYPDD